LNFHGAKFSRSRGGTVYVILRVVDNLKTILAPTHCVPHTAQQLHEYLGYDGQLLGTVLVHGLTLPLDRRGFQRYAV
jgi:hypothetical protein